MNGNEKDILNALGFDECMGTVMTWRNAIVRSTDDPANLRRIKVQCEEILQTNKSSGFCYYEGGFFGKGYGQFLPLPLKGDNVIVRTANGSPIINDDNPLIWNYGQLSKGDKPSVAGAKAYTLVMPDGGHRLKLDFDENNNIVELVHSNGNNIKFTNDAVTITSDGNTITMQGANINIKNASGSELDLNTLIKIGNSFGTIKTILDPLFTAMISESAIIPASATAAQNAKILLNQIFA